MSTSMKSLGRALAIGGFVFMAGTSVVVAKPDFLKDGLKPVGVLVIPGIADTPTAVYHFDFEVIHTTSGGGQAGEKVPCTAYPPSRAKRG